MRFVSCFARVMGIGALLALALPTNEILVPRQAAATRVYGIPGNAWIEIISARPNGQLLLARLDAPELWGLDPVTKQGSKLLSFAGAASVTGIAEISPDVFAVITGNFSTKGFSVKAGSWAVWKVDFTTSPTRSTQVKLVPESGFFIGTAAIDKDNILIADAGKGVMYKVNMNTGNYSVVFADKSMVAPPTAGIVEGIHGLKYHNGYAYYTNTFGSGFYKLKVDEAGKAFGTPQQLAPLASPEDFAFADDGSAYVTQLSAGVITKVTTDGKTSKATSAASCSSVVFGRGATDRNVLYISTSNGAVMSITIS